jgi:hypothetical protein
MSTFEYILLVLSGLVLTFVAVVWPLDAYFKRRALREGALFTGAPSGKQRLLALALGLPLLALALLLSWVGRVVLGAPASALVLYGLGLDYRWIKRIQERHRRRDVQDR